MGKPILYNGSETDFNHLGLGVMHNTTSALVTEERNGSFVLDVVYQLDDNDLVGKEIKVGNLIKADAGHKLKNQRFRIKRITRAMNNQIKIYAEHISYLSYDLQINNHASVTGTGDIAIKGWKQAIMGTVNPFTVSSDIQTDTTTIWTLEEQQNARLALGGSKGSLLDLWGGEFQFDNYDIKLLAQRGKVADTIIAYGRNLEEFEDETDITDVFTSIRPFVKYTDEKTKQEKYIFASPEIIDHANASKFPNKKVFVYDMSSEFDMSAGKLPTPANIATKATAYMKANDFGVPKTTMKLSYVDLSKTLDYTQYKALEEVNLCDMIPIHYEKLGVTGNAKITKVVWNVLADSYDSLELGQPARSLAQRFAQIEKTAKESGKQASYALGVALTAGDQQVFYGDTEPPASTVGLVDGAIWYKQHGTNGVEMYTWDSNTATWIYVIGENDGANLEAQLTAEIQKRDVQIGAIDQVAQDAKSQAQNVANQIALIDASARNLMSGSSFNAVTSTGVWEYPLTIPIKANTDYSFGGMMNPDKNVNMKIEIVPASGSTGTGFTLGTPVTLPNGVNTRVGVSGKSTTAIPKAIVRFTPTDLTAKTAHSESMLTESTIPQDWQPAPEDIQKGIYGLQQDLTKAQTDITNAKTALDNLEIGGRNYLRDSASPYIKPYLNATSTVKNDVVVAEWKASDAVEYTFSGGTSNIFGTLNNTNVVPKVPYTDDEKSLIPLRNYIHSIYIKNLSTHPIGISNNNGVTTTIAANETRRLVMKTYKAGSSIANLQFVFQNASGVIGVDHHFIVWHAQVELGTAVTDWKASPMDAEVSFKITNDSIATKVSQTTFNTLKGTVDGHTTQLTQTADAIKLKADKDSVDTLTQRVTKNESDIDLNTDAIKLKVNQTDYDALAKTVGQHTTTINQTSSQIGLMATKTELNTKANQTDFAALQVSVGQISTKVSQHDGKFSTITQDVDKIETRIVGATGLLKDPEMADATIKPSFGATSGITVAHESTGWRVKNTGTATARAFWSYSSSGTGQMYEQVNANQTYSGRLVMQVPTAMVGKEFTFQIGDGNLSIKPTSTAATVYEFVTHPSTSGAVSVWLPIAGECVIREITVRELNTDITTAKVSKMTQDINGLTVTVGTKASTADLKVQTDRITTVVSQTNKADWYAQAADGFGLTLDPYFDKSTNSFQLYDYDASVDNVKMSRQQVTSAGTMPTWPQHKYRMVFTATDAILIGTRGSNGGWSTPMQSRANAIFLVRFTALLPSGNNFQNGSNSIGTNGSRTWLTSQAGTGNWTDYAYLVKCGNAGTFSTFGFQYVTGSKDPTAAAPLTWYVSKYDIIDVTESFQNSVSSQITQLSDSINLRVSKNDVVNQINVSTEGIKIDGTKVHITGSTLIDNAVIKDAMIANLKTSKLTADTINASVMSLIKINANQLIAGTIDAARIAAKSITADKLAANAIQVGFNAVGSTLKLDYDSLDIYKDGKKRMALESNGMTFWEENGTTKMGTIGTNSLATKPNVRGLVTDLDFPTEYAAWAYQKTISGLYTTMLVLDPRGTYGADGFSGVRVDTALRVMGETQLLDGVQPNGAATATINFTTSTFNGNNYSALQQENNKSGVIFGNYLYLLHNGVVYSFEDVKKVVWALLGMGKISIPTNINSSGVVTTWKNATV